MKKIDGAIFGAYSALVSTRHKWSREVGPQIYLPETHRILRDHALTLAHAFQEVEWLVFARAANDLVAEIDRATLQSDGSRVFSGQNLGSALGHLNTLSEFLGLDLRNRYLFVLEASRLRYYEHPSLFGDLVFNNFSSANDDISEAGTCLALDRGTACVMHLNRVMEAALAALAKALDISHKNDWGKYLKEIDAALTKRYGTSVARSPEEVFYSEAALTFDRVRRAWRNPSMHIDRSYSPDRAQEILEAVKAFLGHLATKISE